MKIDTNPQILSLLHPTAPAKDSKAQEEIVVPDTAESSPPANPASRSTAYSPPMMSSETKAPLLDYQEQQSSPASNTQTSSTTDQTQSNAVTEFLDYMSKTPEERLYEKLLAEEGYTKEQLDSLPPELRERVEEKIKEKMKELLTGQSGIPGQSTMQTDISV